MCIYNLTFCILSFFQNGFPSNLIHKQIRKFLDSQCNNDNNNNISSSTENIHKHLFLFLILVNNNKNINLNKSQFSVNIFFKNQGFHYFKRTIG